MWTFFGDQKKLSAKKSRGCQLEVGRACTEMVRGAVTDGPMQASAADDGLNTWLKSTENFS